FNCHFVSAISIEPDIGGTSLSRPDQSLNCAGSCDNYKQSTVEPNFGIEIQRFNVPLKVYPGNRSYQMLPLNERVQLTEFPCPEKGCSSILRTRTALRKHALVHAERRFSCNNCGRSFAERTKLNRHMLTHTGERAFKVRSRTNAHTAPMHSLIHIIYGFIYHGDITTEVNVNLHSKCFHFIIYVWVICIKFIHLNAFLGSLKSLSQCDLLRLQNYGMKSTRRHFFAGQKEDN
ncbi:zinc finger, C2H2 type, partial [Necator americanus]